MKTETATSGRSGVRLRAVVVGAGKMARQHVRAIHAAGRGEVTAIVDPNPTARDEALAGLTQALGFATLEDALAAGTYDVAHVCTPPATHAELARQLLRAGAHVYVEKPFSLTAHETRAVLDTAETQQRLVCAGHQLLFEGPARRARGALPALGRLVHVESYFSFRGVRAGAHGRPDRQLVDILPHPVYLLLEFLAAAAPDGDLEFGNPRLGPAATVHILVRRGELTGSLVVTLEGRPIESFTKLVGTNGTFEADFVRGSVRRLIGPGVSGIDKALNPFRVAWQTWWGTTGALGARVLKRKLAYPGLTALIDQFHGAIQGENPIPIAPERILETVRLCEHVGVALSDYAEDQSPSVVTTANWVTLVTGGTGFLGRRVVEALRQEGRAVRVAARSTPVAWERVPDVDYVECDVAEHIPPSVMAGVDAVLHCAAATSGSWPEHQRNSIDATTNVIRAAAAAGVESVVQVSSLAVVTAAGRQPIAETSPHPTDSRQRGPYVWGKLESERAAVALGRELGVTVRIVRPGAIIDYDAYEPPGVLGRAIGSIFVAVGSRRERVGSVTLDSAARFLAWSSSRAAELPEVVHLLDPTLPTKGELVTRLRQSNPDIRVVWLPRWLLVPLSAGATVLQKVLRPKAAAISVARVFEKRRYDTGVIARLTRTMEQTAERVQA